MDKKQTIYLQNLSSLFFRQEKEKVMGIDEKVEPIYKEVLDRNPGEVEFH